MKEPFLYHLYDAVRRNKLWITPGPEEYLLLVELVHSGAYPIRTFDDMAFLLETIWLKSHQYRDKFRLLLEERRTEIKALAAVLEQERQERAKRSVQQVQPAVLEPATTHTPPVAPTVTEEAQQLRKTPEPMTSEERPSVQEVQPAAAGGAVGFSIGDNVTGTSKTFRMPVPSAKPVQEVPFLFTNDYFPVKNRYLQQAWRSLNSKMKGAEVAEVNLARTIEHTAKQGYFSTLLYDRKPRNQVRLFIFLDQSESMAAVSDFGKELCTTARQSELHAGVQPWYFYKVPRYNDSIRDYTLSGEGQLRHTSLRKLFAGIPGKDIAVLIYSDAGVFQRDSDEDRLEQTLDFIRRLGKHCNYMAWLNPAPKDRWGDTHAGTIRREVPMFETLRSEVEQAIDALRGKISYQQQNEIVCYPLRQAR